ncbi:HPP family protein [Streptomonospora nanhaiensis]|uniref:CBS domain-containing protein n=1 Tax=Streptomonospora nanhaiensis TaxID=1323731 RepID=A0A853BKL3_9ACTN|nr:CBS domain-containing protein [Streptomonospora nanhaiensis]MBV2364151.1 CBS domain-containing protein [Streptomonospora nanhaiensis]MBX9389454.1 CBS domain-containing protein [Streptomonospora nanhaiensis]NYI95101.1 CBS domain-containing protein [Streptomonospora nanhaiensis]
MLVREMMSPPEVVLTEDTTVREAARLLFEYRCEGAPVASAEGALVGIVTENDLLGSHLAAAPDVFARNVDCQPGRRAHLVGEVMTRAVVTAAEDDDACALSRRMFENRIRAVPVLRGDHVVGLVRRRDILRLHLRPDAEVRRDVRAAIAEVIPGHQDVAVSVVDGAVEVAGADDHTTRRAVSDLALTVPGIRSIEFAAPSGTGRSGGCR